MSLSTADNSTSKKCLRIATRESPLALWQAHFIRDRLLAAHTDLNIEIIGMTTQGDRILDRALSKVGGKGLFLKELEEALLANQADIAVHSMKDVTVDLPEGLEISVVCERENPHDAFVSNHFASLQTLPAGSVVGTSSLRRKTQLMHHFPELVFKDLRGNVNTRLKKLDDGEYDAIILAAAGLIRLGYQARIAQEIPPATCLPAIGQGIIGVECRENDAQAKHLLAVLNDQQSQHCLTAERTMNRLLNGGCQAPIAGHAVLLDKTIQLSGAVGDAENGDLLVASAQGAISCAESIGKQVAQALLEQGAEELIARSRNL